MSVRRGRAAAGILTLFLGALVVGCKGGGDDRPDIAITTQAAAQSLATAPTPEKRGAAQMSSTAHTAVAMPLRSSERTEIASQAASTGAAVRRWDRELDACRGVSGEADDSGATCTHAAWHGLVFQVDVANYYMLGHLSAMPAGACRDALETEADALRGFWNAAAPLDLAWLDEQQRPPSLFDLESAVALLRPVPTRIRSAVATSCVR